MYNGINEKEVVIPFARKSTIFLLARIVASSSDFSEAII